MIQTFSDVIDRFEGPAKFARAVGMNPGAAKQAKRRNSLSSEWFAATVRAAQERGLTEITADRLLEIAEQRRSAA